MAPRPAAAAQQKDEGPILKLIMEKGPLSGETRLFKPETIVRIGRVVKGNNLSIKDPGISSKHLLIQLEPASDSVRRRWTVTDLGSSNGTILNGYEVRPSDPTSLSDGDVVKIGETTVIKVKFESGSVSESESGNGRRNVRRRGKNQDMELVVIDEDSELGLGDDLGIRYNLRGKSRKGKTGILESEVLKSGRESEAKIGKRRTRGSKARVLEIGDEEIEEKNVDNLGDLTLKSKKNSSERENVVGLETDTHDSAIKYCDVVELDGKWGTIRDTRTRSSTKNETILDDLQGIVSVGWPRASTRRTRSTRSSRMKENLVEKGVDNGSADGKRTRKGTRGKSNLPIKTTAVGDDTKEESKLEPVCEEDKVELETNELVQESIKSDAGSASTSEVKENAIGSVETVVDLKKMTLGEWFEFLEVHLPKQIVDTTEEMISEMELNVRRLNEFVLQKNNDKERGESLA